MPIDPRISLGVQPIQIADPLAQYGQVQNILAAQDQRRAAGTQNELAQAQLGQVRTSLREAQEAQDYITQVMAEAKKNNAPTSDPMDAAMQMLNHPNAKVREAGKSLFDANQTVLAYQQDKLFANRTAPQPIAATALPPAAGARPAPEMNDETYKAWLADKTDLPFRDWLGQQTAKQANALAPAPAAPTNALAPVAAPAQGNALAVPSRASELLAEINDLRTRFPYSAKAKEQIAFLTERYKEAIKPQIVAPGSSIVVDGQSIFTAKDKPQTQTDLVRNYEYAKTPAGGNFKGTFAEFKAISTPKTTITTSTEKKYGEQFAGKMAEADITKMATAEKAPQLAESANRIIDLVNQGNLFTGPVADVKLNIARALNVAGASNDEKIANTESLIAATGQSTLDAIKSAGLGTGQGFTDKDLKFLQGIAGGTITYTPQTLTELARLQHQAAVRSAEAWNKRVKQLPKSATEGTGLSLEPIIVPPLSSAKSGGARPEGVGADWTLENDAAGNRAWVSPDRKSFKEVK
jgi:hypothetical protein